MICQSLTKHRQDRRCHDIKITSETWQTCPSVKVLSGRNKQGKGSCVNEMPQSRQQLLLGSGKFGPLRLAHSSLSLGTCIFHTEIPNGRSGKTALHSFTITATLEERMRSWRRKKNYWTSGIARPSLILLCIALEAQRHLQMLRHELNMRALQATGDIGSNRVHCWRLA